MKYFNLKNKNSGFTLVEMMVAIAVFSIVMVTAMSALLNVIDANGKARAIKTAINNISFALEGISKDMRMGTDYACGTVVSNTEPSGDCPSGGDIIKYRSPRAAVVDASTTTRKYAYYRFTSPKIEECLGTNTITCTKDGPWSAITSDEVTLKKVVFYILGVANSHDVIATRTQPRIIMTVSGEAGTKDKIKTSFDLQTSVSQRVRVGTL